MMMGNYQEALTSFAFASEIDTDNPQHHFNAAECFFALHRIAEGLQALKDAEKLAQAKEENKELLSRIKALRMTHSNKK